MSLLQNSNAISDSGYNIANSLRFQAASSQYLSRTPASAGNRQKFTYSAWIKIGSQTTPRIFSTYVDANNQDRILFGNGSLLVALSVAGTQYTCATAGVYRDPSSWYHVVVAIDTTQATAANRVLIYVNGSSVVLNGSQTYPPQNTNLTTNNTVAHWISGYSNGLGDLFDGYLSEINFIDGQALTPSSFGETNTLTGQWVAKKYTGTYGTNGFYLKFANGTSTTTLGSDSSGNGNNWTLTNFTRSAGTSDCWMKDVPSGNGGASGTQPSSNYCVMNPLNYYLNPHTFSNGNLTYVSSSLTTVRGSFSVRNTDVNGKWYYECLIENVATNCRLGFDGLVYFSSGQINIDGSSIGTYTSYTTNDIIGVALNLPDKEISFYKNGSLTHTATFITSQPDTPIIAISSSGSATFNFGQRSFAYTPPSGFKALCTANLPASTIVKGNEYMDATLYTGNGTSQTIVNAAAFAPDLVWVKSRSTLSNHAIFDTVRGDNLRLSSNTTNAEATLSGFFVSNGFETSSNANAINASGQTYVAWQWNAGSSTVTNTSGSISSQVRANPTSGVSVVTYTGNGTGGATIGHGLGIAPAMVIVKERGNANGWYVYHQSLGNTRCVYLDSTSAQATVSIWNNTTPTSSVITYNNGVEVNRSGGTYVAYCFAEIAGFSKFGSYTGNGSTDGTFVYTGFRPRYVLIKCSSTGGLYYDWAIFDTARATYNVIGPGIYANSSAAEFVGTYLDIVSNGFKLRDSSTTWNQSGQTYIYACFAESPFANANAR